MTSNEIIEALEKVKRQGPDSLTEEELAGINDWFAELAEILKPIAEAFTQMAIGMARVLNEWWESLPAETRELIKQSVDKPLQDRKSILQEALIGKPDSLIGREVNIQISSSMLPTHPPGFIAGRNSTMNRLGMMN